MVIDAGVSAGRLRLEAIDAEQRKGQPDAIAGAALLNKGGAGEVDVQPAALVVGVKVLWARREALRAGSR